MSDDFFQKRKRSLGCLLPKHHRKLLAGVAALLLGTLMLFQHCDQFDELQSDASDQDLGGVEPTLQIDATHHCSERAFVAEADRVDCSVAKYCGKQVEYCNAYYGADGLAAAMREQQKVCRTIVFSPKIYKELVSAVAIQSYQDIDFNNACFSSSGKGQLTVTNAVAVSLRNLKVRVSARENSLTPGEPIDKTLPFLQIVNSFHVLVQDIDIMAITSPGIDRTLIWVHNGYAITIEGSSATKKMRLQSLALAQPNGTKDVALKISNRTTNPDGSEASCSIINNLAVRNVSFEKCGTAILLDIAVTSNTFIFDNLDWLGSDDVLYPKALYGVRSISSAQLDAVKFRNCTSTNVPKPFLFESGHYGISIEEFTANDFLEAFAFFGEDSSLVDMVGKVELTAAAEHAQVFADGTAAKIRKFDPLRFNIKKGMTGPIDRIHKQGACQ